MNFKSTFLILFVGALFASCITQKDLVYLQNPNNLSDTSSVVIKAIQSDAYKLQVNDLVKIDFKSVNDSRLVKEFIDQFSSSTLNTNTNVVSEAQLYFNSYQVDDHGNIRIPTLGEINVLGFTVEQVRKKIEDIIYADYFNKATTEIFVNVKLAGIRYTINGEVGNTGTKVIYNDKATIMDAIANSGDITLVGDRKDVIVMRQYPHGTEIHSINLLEVSAMESPYYILKPNDYIYVKPLKQKTLGFGTNGLQTLTTIISSFTLMISTYLLVKNL
ncbi:polysaccharide biosynthesis/export family protein [Flavobacterium agricola]|uniref:Polysaccharide biosynthesis/export family protein n=1 Tax=Flavobacterium agricola TaxID=2870839 RepID=A0ABY6LX33_9FLAO|nr:polysaccharide biosynthesis/export family protein [Flavobacterium agricola]UYW00527.1 polysaccharide biosynthesis/export family protein [Flavobacterium agricola]